VRVLFSSTSGHGHIYPMLPLARAFAASGHDVLWAIGAQAAERVARAGIETADCGATGPVLAGLRAEVFRQAVGTAPADRGTFVFPRMFGAMLTPLMAADLLPLARHWRPDLMVHENAELASPLVGALVGVPSLTHAFGGPVPPGTVAEAGDRLAPLWAAHGRAIPPYAGCFDDVYLDICPASVRAEPLRHIADVQPLRPVADIGHDTGGPTTPGADAAPLVYVTMGTVNNRVDTLGPIVDAVAGLPVRVLVAVGHEVDPADLGDQPAHVRIERWVDQPRVLQECAAVVSHGGSGTFLGALACGVPQLCLPQAADQFRNAEGGVRAGAVLSLAPGEATPAAIRSAVLRLLDDAELRRGAGVVAAEIAVMPSPDQVAKLLVERYG
jgi:hypothetical protein